ncbi:MAG TPA: LUD domain-containing protein [Casimicrobiaceae bacterium]|nr:LUD domain-containing protein [Casimicrobiaceae bacterium]
MSSREDILARVRRNQPSATALPDVPTFDRAIASLSQTFKAAFTRMGGKLAEPPRDGNLTELVRSLFPDARVICSATPEVQGNRALDLEAPPAALDDVDVGVVRAVYGVAETGSVWITQAQFKVSALGFLSQHLVVLLDPAEIVPNLHHAYRRQTDFDTGYGAFMTGPSATADIEGVLIHGAQGIRTLTIVLVAPG